MWPSFMWKLMNDERVLEIYGIRSWMFIPDRRRHWWIESVEVIPEYHNVTIEYPVAIFESREGGPFLGEWLSEWTR